MRHPTERFSQARTKESNYSLLRIERHAPSSDRVTTRPVSIIAECAVKTSRLRE
jgi:hypothetical protein